MAPAQRLSDGWGGWPQPGAATEAMTANESTPSEGQESIAPDDWPKFSVEIQVDVPEEVVEVARERMQLGHEKGVVSEDVTLEDYLEDHMDLDWEFNVN